MRKIGDVGLELLGNIATVEIQRPPNNFFDLGLINCLADAFAEIDEIDAVRASVLSSKGKHFCAGANFSNKSEQKKRETRLETDGNPLYKAATRLFSSKKPIVGAIQGAAVGGGFGLAVMPDFRIVSPETRFTANFVKLGFHPGFGLTHTLPKIIGHQKASLMFLTGQRINGETAYKWRLADGLTTIENIRSDAIKLAKDIAENAPLALVSVRATMREGIAEAVKNQTDIEFQEQFRLQKTKDHKEGIKAVAERRRGQFTGE